MAGVVNLTATGLCKNFGALKVLDNINFSMTSDEVIGIVGPNGAGKSTLLSVLTGAHLPTAGQISFDGKNITVVPIIARSKMGLIRTHQIPKPFLGLSIFENVYVAASHAGSDDQSTAYDYALEALELCGMMPIANRPAESVGLLDRKRLELARALATQPRILLLDEIGGGLTDEEASELVDLIRGLHGRGIGIVWIEHIVHILLQVAKRLICMDAGKIIADGDPKVVMSDPEVVRAYLGGGIT